MARQYHPATIAILKLLSETKNGLVLADLKLSCGSELTDKDFYNFLFRLTSQDLIKKNSGHFTITEEGQKLISRLAPVTDGVWKIVIFDIPERHKKVRVIYTGC